MVEDSRSLSFIDAVMQIKNPTIIPADISTEKLRQLVPKKRLKMQEIPQAMTMLCSEIMKPAQYRLIW